jgi:branched-chain amino acid transport system ATP-binding protein
MILSLTNISMRFGGIVAVSQLDFSLEKGSITALIGPNGAGKTTVFNILTGVYKPTTGQVLFEGQSLTGLKPYQITRRGMARTFQNIRLFKDLSVLDNVLIAADSALPCRLVPALLQTNRILNDEKIKRKRCHDLLKLFDLQHRSSDPANSLPYGAQRRLEMARALATGCRMLFLDEPAAGLNTQEKDELMGTISKIHKELGLTILLIEHDMKLVMGISQRILVLDHGVKIADGSPHEIQNNTAVLEAYLGKGRRQQ